MDEILHSSNWSSTFTLMLSFSTHSLSINALGIEIIKKLWRSFTTLVCRLDIIILS